MGSELFQHSLAFDPACDFDSFLRQAPSRWVVYLFADADDRPIQLLCVKNLRYSLKRRLSGDENIGPSKRVNYRELVRRIYYRQVYSAFEADWIYLEAARQIFPESYQGMVGFHPAWFVHVDPDAEFPRYTKTINLSGESGQYMGPVEDKHAAARLMQVAEDSFDLCRYYNILLESPHGKACAYKEMGKCPAPCDGTISMNEYREMVRQSASAVIAPMKFQQDHSELMQQAAKSLRFEAAQKIKHRMESMSQLGKGPFRHVRLLQDFRFLSLQPGAREGTAKLFLITPTQIEEVAAFVNEPADTAELIDYVQRRVEVAPIKPVTTAAAELIGVVAHHLFSPKNLRGQFLPLENVTEAAVLKAFRELKKQKPAPEVEAEGVLKELDAL